LHAVRKLKYEAAASLDQPSLDGARLLGLELASADLAVLEAPLHLVPLRA